MRLRAVEMVGFKSFRDRVCVEISDGMTCIVGPNGCGKSNVVDAIKWAMGDMSPKSLRGSSMRDVIFAGTEKLKPAGMAEVTLTFENTAVTKAGVPGRQTELDDIVADAVASGEGEGEEAVGDDANRPRDTEGDLEDDDTWDLGKGIPRQFRKMPEIAITRRLHRSGESEYLINKTTCRLRDIRSLLAGTGLGKQGYSIIEQGQIGFIVNARPSKRRLIIEEASGITRYKDRRKRAQRKLDRTEQNLQRTRDILDEIEGRMHSLEAQAKKARQHRRLRRQLESLEVALLLDRRREAVQTAEKLQKQLQKGKKKLQKQNDKLEEAESNLKQARRRAEQMDQRHGDVTENFYKVETRLNLAQSNRDHARQTRREADQRRQELIDERTRQRERRKHVGQELERMRVKLEEVDDQPGEASAVIERLEGEVAELKEQRRGIAKRRDELRASIEEHRASVRRIDDRREWIDEQVEQLQTRQQEMRDDREELDEERETLERGISRLTLDHEQALEERGERAEKVEKLESRLQQVRQEFNEATRTEEKLARRRLKLQARIDSLEELRRQGEGYADGVRRVLEWARETNRSDIFGPVGDFLEVPQGCESAYAAFLGERVGDVMVRDRQAALDALAVLAREGEGRVGCFVLGQQVEDPAKVAGGWLEGLEIVDDLGDVPDRPDDSCDAGKGWATRDGDVVFADGRVVGGSTGEQAEAALRQSRQLEQLRSELDDVVDEHDEAGELLELAGQRVETVERELEKEREGLQKQIHRVRGIKQELEGEKREKTRADARMDRLVSQERELAKTRQRLVDERSELDARRAGLVDDLPEDEQGLADVEKSLQELDRRIEELGEELTERKVEVAQVDERRRHLAESVERGERDVEHATQQVERLTDEIDEQRVRGKEARMRSEALATEVEELKQNHAQLGDEVEQAKRMLAKVGDEVETLELTVLGVRQDRDEAQEMVQQLQMSRREAQLEIEHVGEQLEERFEFTIDEARQKAAQCEVPADARQARAAELKQSLQSIGEVNALAIEEFEETKERYQFHTEQQSDLEESVSDLRVAIERMDWESRKRFRQTFDAVNEKFREVFPRLFQGGQARLLLTEPDDLLDTGVDIEVQPPGKKLQNVNLLSGGEKALTAVSLIFSIFLLKPSPFAVLDEVDAPLDDANVGRFAEMVSELSEISQMIVITHNRRTMEAPEKLYGVTMEEAGISKVVSVTLSELDDRLAS